VTDTSLTADAAEAIEAEFMRAYVAAAPAGNDAAIARIGGGVVLAMRHDPTGYWNKALGFTEPITGGLIDEILGFYRAHGLGAATLQLRTETLPGDWAEICAARGIEDSGRRIVKLVSPIDETTPAAPGGLDVAPVTAADAYEWAALVLGAFGFPLEGQVEMLTATVGDERCRPYAVWASDPRTGDRRIVAGANLYLDGEVADLNTGATSAGFRGQGAQSALIAARIAAAREAGCRWIVSETGWSDETPRHPSLNNMRRAGLKPAYIRPNWRWTARELSR
jgi:GNAT superfamily N-acetyltransferase